MARILVADDHAETVAMLSAELGGDGHDVLEAADGYDAYQRVLELRPDLVFLGAALPIYDGFETCSMLRADPDVPDHLPVVLLYDGDVNPKRLEQAGFTDAFPRVHDSSRLREEVSRWLAH